MSRMIESLQSFSFVSLFFQTSTAPPALPPSRQVCLRAMPRPTITSKVLNAPSCQALQQAHVTPKGEGVFRFMCAPHTPSTIVISHRGCESQQLENTAASADLELGLPSRLAVLSRKMQRTGQS